MVALTITTDDDRIVSINVDADEVVENVKAILEVEAQVPIAEQRLLFNGQELANTDKLSAKGVKDNDLLMLIRQQQAPAGAPGGGNPMAMGRDGSALDPMALIQHIKGDPHSMSSIRENQPELHQAIVNNDINKLQDLLRQAQHSKDTREMEMQRQIALLNADPMNIEAQAKIEEMIRQKNVEENMSQAMEYTPESFASVIMLYVNMEVNGRPLKAFVDSGAQSTIMSQQCAERCGIMRLVDKRFSGIAKGVGTSKIIGRVHSAPINIGGQFLPCTFTILENQDMEFLFGLDMLKRHQVCIDLRSNVLDFTGIGVKLPFLQEGDLPMRLRGEPEVPPESPSAAAPAPAAPPAAPAAAAPSPWANPGGPPAAAAAAAPPAAAAAPPAAGGGRSDEEKIASLMALGLPREMCVQALQATGGNEEAAAAMLFGGMD